MGKGSIYSLANYSFAYEETQSNRVSDFHNVVCSLFPKAFFFTFIFVTYHYVYKFMKSNISILFNLCLIFFCRLPLDLFKIRDGRLCTSHL